MRLDDRVGADQVALQLHQTAGMFSREQAPFTCMAALLMSLQPILVTVSKNSHGGFDYSVPSSTMLSLITDPIFVLFGLIPQVLISGFYNILI